ncbi:hypothetical protein ACWD4B_11135 [Streptomyces sp. NPDC002536]|uniref:hypothetical protein n=1 Tax=Streptoverticillium reticulum TaxID=1433415 RepID=UPI00301039AB
MTQGAVPDEAVPSEAASPQQDAPKGLLQQMEELMAALNANLSQLDADLQSSAQRFPPGAEPAHDAGGAGPDTAAGDRTEG